MGQMVLQGAQPLTISVGCVWGQRSVPDPVPWLCDACQDPARLWEVMLWVLRVPDSALPFLPDPWAGRRQTPTSQAAHGSLSCSPRAAGGKGGGAIPQGDAAQDPALLLSPSHPPLPTQTTQLTRVYKAHWLKGTELSEKINPTTRHI